MFSTTPRALVASFAGYLVGSTLNAAVFNFGMFLGMLPVTTILGTVVSFGLAKVAYEAVMYPVTKQVTDRVKALE